MENVIYDGLEWEISPLPIESSSADDEYEWVFEATHKMDNGIEVHGLAYYYGDYLETAEFRDIEYNNDDFDEEDEEDEY